MSRARQGDTVQVHYTGKFSDGTVFDSTADRGPVQFTIGAGEVIQGIEDAVTGMEPGESKSATIPPEQAFGPHRPEMVAVIERERLPEDLEPTVGQELAVRQTDGRQLTVMVREVSDTAVVLDANHALAGKELTIDLELVEVGAGSR